MAALIFSSVLLAPVPRIKCTPCPPSGHIAFPHCKRFGIVAPSISSSALSLSERALSGYFSSTPSCTPSVSGVRRRGEFVSCRAAGGDPPEALNQAVYQGIYGPWSLEDSDNVEVILYRSGLVAVAVSFVTVGSTAFLPEGSIIKDIITKYMDILYATGAGGLGLALFLIHIYVTPIKRFLQALWAVGVLGSLGTYTYFAQPVNESLVNYVIDHPGSVWLIGPLFASLTGLVFKEGLCYGKLEAGILTFIIPSLLLGHLSGLMDDNVKLGFLSVWMALFVVFSARKFTQPIKDDIGDKSVFIFNALPEDEKKLLLQKLEMLDEKPE